MSLVTCLWLGRSINVLNISKTWRIDLVKEDTYIYIGRSPLQHSLFSLWTFLLVLVRNININDDSVLFKCHCQGTRQEQHEEPETEGQRNRH